jgi:hypothetical protein
MVEQASLLARSPLSEFQLLGTRRKKSSVEMQEGDTEFLLFGWC